MRKIYFIMLLLLAVGCGKSVGPTYRIGVDLSWYPINLMGKEVNVTAFTNDLLAEVAKRENIEFRVVSMSWDNLLWGLKEGKYDAMLSSLYPYVFNLDVYDFSKPYLSVGSVLVTRYDSDIDSIDEIGDREIGVATLEEEAELISYDTSVIVRFYDSMQDGFAKVVNGELDGIVVGVIPGVSFVRDLYAKELKIASKPLTPEGFRLVSLHGEEKDLIQRFNDAIEKLQDDGTYMELAKKWALDN